jgi:hypothetical protein
VGGIVYVLHQDFWFWRDAHPLVFGFLPIGLFYHAAYTVASSLVLWALLPALWPRLDEPHVDAAPENRVPPSR